MSILKDMAKKGKIDTKGDVLDITGTIMKNQMNVILKNSVELNLSNQVKSTVKSLREDGVAPDPKNLKLG